MPNQYTLLDPIRIGLDFAKAYDLAIEGIVLQTSIQPEDFQEITPHLFPCETDSQLYDWITTDGRGDSWGIFIKSELDLETLATQLQKLLIVSMQTDGRQVYFRFYDPRVLRGFLPTCQTTQLKEIFTGVENFYCEDEDDDYQLHFSLENEQLKIEKIPVFYQENQFSKKISTE
jgi:hypothetical protein